MRRSISVWGLVLVLFLGFACSDNINDSSLQNDLNEIKRKLLPQNNNIEAVFKLLEAQETDLLVTSYHHFGDKKIYQLNLSDGTRLKFSYGEPLSPLGIEKKDGKYYWVLRASKTTEFLKTSTGDDLLAYAPEQDEAAVKICPKGCILVHNELWKSKITPDLKIDPKLSLIRSVEQSKDALIFKLDGGCSIELALSMNPVLLLEEEESTDPYFTYKVLAFNTKDTLYVQAAGLRAVRFKSTLPAQVKTRWIPEENIIVIETPELKKNISYYGGEVSLEATDRNGVYYKAFKEIVVSIDYTDPAGTFILTEGNMSDAHGTVAFYDGKGTEFKNCFSKANDGLFVGNVLQDMYMANGRIYLLTQNGAEVGEGGVGRFVVCDQRTLRMEYADNLVFSDPAGDKVWPQHLVVCSPTRALVQYSSRQMERTSGIAQLKLGPQKVDVENTIEGTFGKFTVDGALKGRMIYSRGKVFAGCGQKTLIIDPSLTFSKVVHTISHPSRQVKSLVKAADGFIYAALSGEYEGVGYTAKLISQPKIIKIDEQGEVLEEYSCPEPIAFSVQPYQPSNLMCASFKQPYLYFADTQEFKNYTATRFNYQTKTFDVHYISTKETDWSGDNFYGIMGVNPVTEYFWLPTSDFVSSIIYTYKLDNTSANRIGRYYYGNRSGASPAGVDFPYRFSSEWTNK